MWAVPQKFGFGPQRVRAMTRGTSQIGSVECWLVIWEVGDWISVDPSSMLLSTSGEVVGCGEWVRGCWDTRDQLGWDVDMGI